VRESVAVFAACSSVTASVTVLRGGGDVGEMLRMKEGRLVGLFGRLRHRASSTEQPKAVLG
jgi:hypothetical protein